MAAKIKSRKEQIIDWTSMQGAAKSVLEVGGSDRISSNRGGRRVLTVPKLLLQTN